LSIDSLVRVTDIPALVSNQYLPLGNKMTIALLSHLGQVLPHSQQLKIPVVSLTEQDFRRIRVRGDGLIPIVQTAQVRFQSFAQAILQAIL